MSAEILHGDCVAMMSLFIPDASIDAIVTDPPYELTGARPGGRSAATEGKVMKGFMGMAWDGTGIANSVAMWREALRVLKPGGYLLAFSGTRTYHRMVCAIEDAGFEVRDQIGWLYGSGFPKSHNGAWGGTALKPAWEPIVVARKPLIGTVEANWLAYGTGALNIDGCRVEGEGAEAGRSRPGGGLMEGSSFQMPDSVSCMPAGRWPANIIHDGSDEVLAAFPQAPGQLADASSSSSSRKTQNVYGAMKRGRGEEPSADSDNEGTVGFKMKPGARRLDEGTAARFFYCAKANQKDRNAGCEHLAPKAADESHKRSRSELDDPRRSGTVPRANHHPTVKPTELMRYLCRLVTPPGGTILDPFTGSGSTGKAALAEGFNFIGCEQSAEYLAIAEARCAA